MDDYQLQVVSTRTGIAVKYSTARMKRDSFSGQKRIGGTVLVDR